jgi:hypothetical protein
VIIKIIVFKSDLIQDSSFEFRVLTGSPGSIFFFKSKRCRFSKKTKVNGLQPGFWPGLVGSIRSHRVFFPLFFLQSGRVSVQINRISNQPAGSGRISKLRWKQSILTFPHAFNLFLPISAKIAKGWKLPKKSICA